MDFGAAFTVTVIVLCVVIVAQCAAEIEFFKKMRDQHLKDHSRYFKD